MDYFILILAICGDPYAFVAHDEYDVYKYRINEMTEDQRKNMLQIYKDAPDENRILIETANPYNCT